MRAKSATSYRAGGVPKIMLPGTKPRPGKKVWIIAPEALAKAFLQITNATERIEFWKQYKDRVSMKVFS